jgi:hypothetical protein
MEGTESLTVKFLDKGALKRSKKKKNAASEGPTKAKGQAAGRVAAIKAVIGRKPAKRATVFNVGRIVALVGPVWPLPVWPLPIWLFPIWLFMEEFLALTV